MLSSIASSNDCVETTAAYFFTPQIPLEIIDFFKKPSTEFQRGRFIADSNSPEEIEFLRVNNEKNMLYISMGRRNVVVKSQGTQWLRSGDTNWRFFKS